MGPRVLVDVFDSWVRCGPADFVDHSESHIHTDMSLVAKPKFSISLAAEFCFPLTCRFANIFIVHFFIFSLDQRISLFPKLPLGYEVGGVDKSKISLT
jgi:hypothetical protein